MTNRLPSPARALTWILAFSLACTPAGSRSALAAYGAVNIAAAENGGQVLAASSEAGEGGHAKVEWRKENLIDGKRVEGDIVPAGSYGWATTVPPSPRDPAWVVFAFAQERPRLVGAVRLDPRTNDPQVIGRWVKNFAIEVSVTASDGPWQRVGTFELINVPRPQTFEFAPARAKYLRLVITSNQGSDVRVGLGEFEVFEALVGDDELTTAIRGLEEEISRLKRYSMARAGQDVQLATEIPDYAKSLIAASNGGRVVLATSEALGEDGQPLAQWQAGNLVDGLIASPGEQPPHNSFGWSSNAKPTPDHPEMVVFAVPGETGAVIDAAVVDPTTRDPWGMMRGAREIEIAVSSEGSDGPWKPVGRWQLPLEPRPQLLHFPPCEARFVRLAALSNYDSDRCVVLGEFGVYRLSDKVDVMGGIIQRIENCVIDLKRAQGGAFGQP